MVDDVMLGFPISDSRSVLPDQCQASAPLLKQEISALEWHQVTHAQTQQNVMAAAVVVCANDQQSMCGSSTRTSCHSDSAFLKP